MNFRDFLLQNWCRVYNASHSELDYCLCQTAVEQVKKYINPTPAIKINIQNVQEDPEEKKVMLSQESSSSNSARDTVRKSAVANCWTLRFDGSKSKQGAEAGFEIISPKGKTLCVDHRLQFHCTNNVAEYEALVHGLLMALKKKVKILQVFGDSELVVKKVRRQYSCHDRRMTNYRHRVWDFIEVFDAFSIQLIPRSKNQTVDSLAQSGSTLQPLSLSR